MPDWDDFEATLGLRERVDLHWKIGVKVLVTVTQHDTVNPPVRVHQSTWYYYALLVAYQWIESFCHHIARRLVDGSRFRLPISLWQIDSKETTRKVQ
jgi:hypothetical protein